MRRGFLLRASLLVAAAAAVRPDAATRTPPPLVANSTRAVPEDAATRTPPPPVATSPRAVTEDAATRTPPPLVGTSPRAVPEAPPLVANSTDTVPEAERPYSGRITLGYTESDSSICVVRQAGENDDVTEHLQMCFKHNPTIVLDGEGPFVISDVLRVEFGRVRVLRSRRGVALVCSGEGRGGIWMEASAELRVEELQIIGCSHSFGEGSMSFHTTVLINGKDSFFLLSKGASLQDGKLHAVVTNAPNPTVLIGENSFIRGFPGVAVYVYGQRTNVRVTGGRIADCGQGIRSRANSTAVTLTNAVIEGMSDHGLSLAGPNPTLYMMQGSIVRQARAALISIMGAMAYIDLVNASLSGSSTGCFYAYAARAMTVKGLNVEGCMEGGLRVVESEGARLNASFKDVTFKDVVGAALVFNGTALTTRSMMATDVGEGLDVRAQTWVASNVTVRRARLGVVVGGALVMNLSDMELLLNQRGIECRSDKVQGSVSGFIYFNERFDLDCPRGAVHMIRDSILQWHQSEYSEKLLRMIFFGNIVLMVIPLMHNREDRVTTLRFSTLAAWYCCIMTWLMVFACVAALHISLRHREEKEAQDMIIFSYTHTFLGVLIGFLSYSVSELAKNRYAMMAQAKEEAARLRQEKALADQQSGQEEPPEEPPEPSQLEEEEEEKKVEDEGEAQTAAEVHKSRPPDCPASQL